MPVIGQPVTYYQKWDFIVEIEGVAVGGFTDATGLEAEVKTVEQKEGGQISPVDISTTTVDYKPVTLKRGGSDNNEIYLWFDNIRNGNQDKRNVSIVQQKSGIPVVRYNLQQCVVSSYKPGEWARSAEEENVMEEVTFKMTRWDRLDV